MTFSTAVNNSDLGASEPSTARHGRRALVAFAALEAAAVNLPAATSAVRVVEFAPPEPLEVLESLRGDSHPWLLERKRPTSRAGSMRSSLGGTPKCPPDVRWA